MTLQVLRSGPLTTVQDFGRRGHAHHGVALSGAADRASLRRANRLVGNPEPAAGLEVLLGGLALRAEDDDHVIAVTGAHVAILVDGRPQGRDTALRLRAGQQLELGPARRGLRAYVGVRGGVCVEPVLGSRSYDQLGDLGPAPFHTGDRITVGDAVAAMATYERIPVADLPQRPVLRVLPGPRLDWLRDGLIALTDAAWTVDTANDRSGIRLLGAALARRTGELLSEGQLPGAVQLPASGSPILLGPDAGVTGGYPVIAVVVRDDLDLVGQLAPGTTLQFRRAL